MGNGEQGETVRVQDRPADDSEVKDAAVEDPSSPAPAVVPVPSEASGVADSGSSDSGSSDSSSSSDAVSPSDSVSSSVSSEVSDVAAGDDAGESGEPAAPTRSSRGSVRDLEEEGEVAADYLEELLDIVDVDGDIDIDVENGRASLAIVAEGTSDRSLRRLVGANGEVLEALQELTRLAVQASTGERSRLMLDVAGHRAHRRKVLTDRATQACEEVKTSGKPLSLEPMSAFERKIVHDVVADAGLESESEGVDPNRHVVILPAAS